jgi:hypothetical protein
LVWSEPMRAASHLDEDMVLLLKLAQYVVQSNLPQLGIVILIETIEKPAKSQIPETRIAVIHHSTRIRSTL